MDAGAIVRVLTDAGAAGELQRLSEAVGVTIAADGDLSEAIVAAGAAATRARGRPHVHGDATPCGSVPTRGEAYDVRPGFCFPDNAECRGSILKNPNDGTIAISTEDIFRRDSLFTNFENTSPRNLGEMIDATNAAFRIESMDPNVFNYRTFFFTDPSDQALISYNKNGIYSNLNLVRLRYDVGISYTRQSANLTIPANATENVEIEAGKRLVPTFSRNSYWTICPAFFTYRMLPLKPGYMTAFGYSRVGTGRGRNMNKCTGITIPGDNDHINDVYVYTFVDSNGILVSNETKINGKTRTSKNSFQGGDLPYEDGFFIFPTDRNGRTVDTVCARYPDGILLFSYDGILSPIPPSGTIVNARRLHRGAHQLPGYPDQATHAAVTNGLNTALNNLVGINRAAFEALTISLGGADRQLGTIPYIRSVIYGAVGYIAMMSAIKQLTLDATLRTFGGGYKSMPRSSHRNRRYNHKSIKRNKSKSKSKGRGRARAASMLKSAKQRFYRRGGGGMGMILSNGPQPVQYDSPLVSQASPV
jgi:hypothetical protein